ncbi:MAG: hypothetical protein NTX28_13030 [Novosphingobium sp.]|nr:hypothetical protein [Novosphingobium sp.]
MRISTRILLTLAVILFMGCAKSDPNPMRTASQCIRRQVAESVTVSEPKAREVLKSCRVVLEFWSRSSVAIYAKKPFDPSDGRMKALFQSHQEALHRHWMKVLSTEYAKANPDYD